MNAAPSLGCGRCLGKRNAKHFDLSSAMAVSPSGERTTEIAKERRLDGIYVIRTSLASGHCGAQKRYQASRVVRVERAFRF